MKKEYKLIERDYKIEILRLSEEDGGGFIAIVPSLPGCMSDGETQEEALTNVRDAIKCWIEAAKELGREIPSRDEYKSDDDYSGKLSLRIPKSLHKQVSETANKEGCSINQLIMMYVSMGIGKKFGEKQLSITYNNQNNEEPIFEEFQRETWKSYKDKPLFREGVDYYNVCD